MKIKVPTVFRLPATDKIIAWDKLDTVCITRGTHCMATHTYAVVTQPEGEIVLTEMFNGIRHFIIKLN